MDDIILRISLQGTEREETLGRIHEVVDAWGLKLPDVPPDPLHFGRNDFARIGETEFNIANNLEQGYCGKLMFLFKGQTCPMHHHRKKHETFFIVKGRIEMEAGGSTFAMNQGDIKVIAQRVKHRFTALADSLVLECSMPDLPDDSIFDDPHINRAIFGIPNP